MKKVLLVLIYGLANTISYSQNVIDSSLVAHYAFNGNADDYSIYGNHASYNNATLTQDRFGNENSAYKFDGQSSFIQVPHSTSLNLGNSFSLCVWVRVDGFYNGLCLGNNVLQKGNDDYANSTYTIRFSDLTNGCNGISKADSTREVFYSSCAGAASPTQYIQKQKWYFLVITYDGSYGKFYIDGKLVNTNFLPGRFFSNTDDLFFGKENAINYPYWLNGCLDDIRIYKRPINKTEIRQLYTEVKAANITGRVFVDNDNNGIQDSLDFGSSYTKVMLSNGDVAFADYQGDYDLYADSTNCQIISVDTVNTAYIPTPAADTLCITNLDTTITKNFRMLLNATPKDSLQVNIVPYFSAARPGFFYPVVVNYLNSGNTTLSPTISFNYDTSIMVYDSSSVTGVFRNWNTITLATNQFIPKQRNFFIAFFHLIPTATLGDSVKLHCNIAGGTATATDSIWERIRGSYDPNDKEATPQLTPTEVAKGKYINYTIRFENTGTDTAFTVMVADELSPLLNVNSFQMIASSHNVNMKVDGRKITFLFKKILLPPTIANKINSHGYIQFRIKPIATVTDGMNINNKAAIYFDYNVPVITNTAVTKIMNPVVLPLKIINYELSVANEKKSINNIWTTSNETNVSHFNVQKSFDGIEFKTIGQVKAQNKNWNNYHFVDNTIMSQLPSVVYYKIASVDVDGKLNFSEIRVYKKDAITASVSLYPNPAKDFVTISKASLQNAVVTINDVFGKEIMKVNITHQQQQVNIQSLEKGVYFVRFSDGKVLKFIKQ